jgi:hypothetical protein
MSLPRKKKHYEEMMVRMTRAIEREFYLEASWYAYAILEDRMIAILHRSGGAHEKKHKTKLMRNFGRKLEVIDKRRKRDSLLKVNFSDSSIKALKTWKDERNDLMHAMANAAIPLSTIDTKARLLATNGRVLVKEMCRAQRRLKKHRHQIPTPAKPFPY